MLFLVKHADSVGFKYGVELDVPAATILSIFGLRAEVYIYIYSEVVVVC